MTNTWKAASPLVLRATSKHGSRCASIPFCRCRVDALNAVQKSRADRCLLGAIAAGEMEVDHEGSGAAQDQDPAARRESVHENAPQLLRRETVRGTTLTLSHRPTTVLVAKLAHLCGARTKTTKLAMFDSPVTSRKNFVLMWEQQPGATSLPAQAPFSLR